ncbi:thiol-disulfide oxidoreductase DCC family protein [Flavobacterium salilacus subsp. salilacus]|uniref:thiol-disulfide oxidoreductase DCC family protein n=1 Tax=Flavobacterium TaxID=237 RepID=UPI001074C34B|nr:MULTISPECIES: thiol-disulfide oxidoreductase DCC family protein [Flavobacterium]KAF2519303.1 thiol-disulfide oxidoreductase DCC family protein [Flavobacterium salilacus subsp. salilacus]MBE1613493.1 thiol-disulfide oxidoreductase DCC family protein [Flavobacterium sp. SaA2.13]
MELANVPKDKKIILFDGVCNLCDSTVQYLIKRDNKDVFRFVALQSEIGKQIIEHIGIDTTETDSIILYEPGKVYYYKAEAAIKIASALGGIYKLMNIFNILPKGLNNKVYDYVAKNRYKWYGKKEECMIPTPEMKAKFL